MAAQSTRVHPQTTGFRPYSGALLNRNAPLPIVRIDSIRSRAKDSGKEKPDLCSSYVRFIYQPPIVKRNVFKSLSTRLVKHCVDFGEDVTFLCKLSCVSKQFQRTASDLLSSSTVLYFPTGKLPSAVESGWVDRCRKLERIVINNMNFNDLNATIDLRKRANRPIELCERPSSDLSTRVQLLYSKIYINVNWNYEAFPYYWDFSPEYQGFEERLQTFLALLEDDLGKYLPQERDPKMECRAAYISEYRRLFFPYSLYLQRMLGAYPKARSHYISLEALSIQIRMFLDSPVSSHFTQPASYIFENPRLSDKAVEVVKDRPIFPPTEQGSPANQLYLLLKAADER
jgi:hypothetical protein